MSWIEPSEDELELLAKRWGVQVKNTLSFYKGVSLLRTWVTLVSIYAVGFLIGMLLLAIALEAAL